MDITQAKAILDKYGRENCMQIIFDNGRVWLTCVPKRSKDPKEAKRGLPQRDPITKKILFEYLGSSLPSFLFSSFSKLFF